MSVAIDRKGKDRSAEFSGPITVEPDRIRLSTKFTTGTHQTHFKWRDDTGRWRRIYKSYGVYHVLVSRARIALEFPQEVHDKFKGNRYWEMM